MIEIIEKTPENVVFKTDMDIGLANAIRRNVNEIPILAIDEVDIYKNDSGLYDQTVAHRLGLMPLKNQKLKKDQKIQLKIKKTGEEVLGKDLGKEVVYQDTPIVLLEKDHEFEAVAKAKVGKGSDHAKFVPGLIYYRELMKIEIAKEGEKYEELAKIYPEIFEFSGKLKVKNDWMCDLDQEDIKDYNGIKITPTKNLVFFIESWGQIDAKEILIESIKEVENNLNELCSILK
jgi:DNA-directed RNA polymerase subunit D